MRFLSSFRIGSGLSLALALFVACDDVTAPPSGDNGTAGAGGHDSSSDACEFGDDADKCGATADAACFPTIGTAEEPCDSDEDCAEGSLCFLSEEATNEAPGVCRALSGVCDSVVHQGSGLSFGETCSLDEEACRGTCVDVGNSDGSGECEETCRVGAESGCGEADLASTNVACAFFAYDLSDAGITQGTGDVGICATLCNCSSDCPGTQRCLAHPVGEYRGVCAGGLDDDEALDDCNANALGGAGGGQP